MWCSDHLCVLLSAVLVNWWGSSVMLHCGSVFYNISIKNSRESDHNNLCTERFNPSGKTQNSFIATALKVA